MLRLRLRDADAGTAPFGAEFERCFEARQAEADAFYRAVSPAAFTEDEALVYRQALAGMLWSKQYYQYDVRQWMAERGSAPRNADWSHMDNADIFSMPDKWEYPWYAAWDLAFHTLALGLVDPDFAKDQLKLTLREQYLHPNGQMPAYEWNFGDVNPPVHAWATAFLYQLDRAQRGGKGDRRWLAYQFNKLSLNFSWWINRKDRSGRNLFEGGFLGLDNIGVFDRSAPLPTGGYLEQADGTAWMAVFCQHMVQIAAELSREDPLYEDMVLRFATHFLSIGSAMLHHGQDGMWDEQDGFFYDVLRRPDGSAERLKVRSVVGLLPLCAAAVFEPISARCCRRSPTRVRRLLEERPELRHFVHPLDQAGQQRPAPAVDRRCGPAPPHPGGDAGRGGVPRPARHPLALAPACGGALCAAGGRPGIPGGVPAGGIRYRDVRRQFELARPGLDAGQRHAGARPADSLRLPW